MKENNFADTLYSRSRDAFAEMISDIQLRLYRTNPTYKKIEDRNRYLRHRSDKILDIFECEKSRKLSKWETEIVTEIISNERELKYIELKELFFVGNKEAFYYFDRIGIIMSEDTSD